MKIAFAFFLVVVGFFVMLADATTLGVFLVVAGAIVGAVAHTLP